MENIEGRKCDRCKENKFDKQQGCVNCPPCYNLVQDAVNMHRNKLQSLEQSIKNISNSDLVSFDADFEEKLKSVRKKVEKLAEDVKGATALGLLILFLCLALAKEKKILINIFCT